MILTAKELAVLRLINEAGVSGYCVRYVWTYTVDRRPETRAVQALRRKGALELSFLSGGRIAYSITEAGRALL